MKVNVNSDCIGCGVCENICPQVFQLNVSDLSEVVGNADEFHDQTLEAAAACPVNAIEVEG